MLPLVLQAWALSTHLVQQIKKKRKGKIQSCSTGLPCSSNPMTTLSPAGLIQPRSPQQPSPPSYGSPSCISISLGLCCCLIQLRPNGYIHFPLNHLSVSLQVEDVVVRAVRLPGIITSLQHNRAPMMVHPGDASMHAAPEIFWAIDRTA